MLEAIEPRASIRAGPAGTDLLCAACNLLCVLGLLYRNRLCPFPKISRPYNNASRQPRGAVGVV